jgi:hypothetical protein
MVRSLRHELAILQTDHKQVPHRLFKRARHPFLTSPAKLMLELETSVLSKSALKSQSGSHDRQSALASGSSASTMDPRESPSAPASDEGTVFFRVFEVAEGGPAQAAGLIDGDTVCPSSRRCICGCGCRAFPLTPACTGSIRDKHIGADHAPHPICAAGCFSGGRRQRRRQHDVAGDQARRDCTLHVFSLLTMRCRSSGDVTLEVRPSLWSGRGVLGCRIAAIE